MRWKFFYCTWIFAFIFSSIFAQQSVVSGTVRDATTREFLPGATIEIVGGKTTRFQSGLDGSFLLRSVVPGTYVVKVFFASYEAFQTSVTIQNGEPKVLDIELERSRRSLTEVNVIGARDNGTEESASMRDRRAPVLQNSVSARAIEISPDLSVANVSQRISGVSLERSSNGEGQYAIIRGMDKRYLYTLVNGVKIPSPDNKNRYVPLDIFPADLLDRLEVTKSLSAEKEGDAIGGSINLIMKDAPAIFRVQANAGLGYSGKFSKETYSDFSFGASADKSPRRASGTNYQATPQDFPNSAFTHAEKHNPLGSVLGVSAGGRLFKNKLGVLVAGSYQNTYRNVSSVFFGTETDRNNGSASVTSIDSRGYSIRQERSGLHTKLDFRFNNKNKIELYSSYLTLTRNDFRAVSDTNLQLGRAGAGTGRIGNSFRTYHEVQRIFNNTLSGNHIVSEKFSFDWRAAWSQATGNRPDQATLKLVTGVSRDPGTGLLVQAPLNLDASSSREFTHSRDLDKTGFINIHYLLVPGAWKTLFTVGAMYRDKKRVSNFDGYTLRPTTPSIQVYDGNIDHNTFAVFNPEGTSDNALNYSAVEKVGATYAKIDIDSRTIEIDAGARFENTALSWNSEVPQTVKGKSGSINYYDVLPSAHIKYTLSKKTSLRASYYAAISRPNFYEVVPHIGGDPEADYNEIGNPDLKRTTADNFDLRYEFYPRALDQMLAGVFYKKLKNPIEYALEDVGTNTYYLPDNFGNATNYGFEFDMVKYFRWFGIRANYTFTNSEITTAKTRRFSTGTGQTSEQVNQTRPLQGQSKHIANLSILVKDDKRTGLNAQLAASYTSRRINTVSQFLDNDLWQKGFVQLDFSVEKSLAKRFFLYAKINNILNTPYQLEIRQPFLQTSAITAVPLQKAGDNVFVRKDAYGSNYLLGIKFKF